MSEAEDHSADDLVAVAKAVRTRGLRGELVADLLTDFPERFEGLEAVIGVAPDGKRLPLALENHFLQEKRIVLKFAGYDSIEAATALIGFEFAVPEADAVDLEEDEFFDWELEGCTVESVDGKVIGTVREVMHTGGVELLVVNNGTRTDSLIPLAEEICIEIDIENRRIRVDPPEGLLEL
jgi:16S rRNA processing protein RimM